MERDAVRLVRAGIFLAWLGTAAWLGGCSDAPIGPRFTEGGPLTVTVSATSATVRQGSTVVLTATVRDETGIVLDAPSVTWTSSAPTVATVVSNGEPTLGQHSGTVRGLSPGTVTITATSGTASGTASVTVTPAVPVVSVTVIPDSATLMPQAKVRLAAMLRDAGGNVLDGRLITWLSDNPAVATVDAIGQVTAVAAGSTAVTATSEGVSDTTAITVRVISFRSVSAGRYLSCGLTTDGAAYCWGWNVYGYGLGDGSSASSAIPVAVSGGLTFSALSAGVAHTCGVTAAGAAYCWGNNGSGQLGDGSTTSSAVPVAVTGGLMFSTVSVGGGHTCGLTAAGAAHCWGWNIYGQLGDGSITPHSSAPAAVTGGFAFAVVSAGGAHTCGVTTDGAAYCWGYLWAYDGYELSDSPVPVAVGGGPYSAVSAGGGVSRLCALTLAGAAYCQEVQNLGNLEGLPGGIAFSAVSVGAKHSCGVTASAVAYCWGDNAYGQLGNGSLGARSSVPLKVAGQP